MDYKNHVPKKKIKNNFKKPKEDDSWIGTAIKYYKAKLFGKGWGGVAYKLRKHNREIKRQKKYTMPGM